MVCNIHAFNGPVAAVLVVREVRTHTASNAGGSGDRQGLRDKHKPEWHVRARLDNKPKCLQIVSILDSTSAIMQALSSKHALGNCNVAASRSSCAQRRAFVPTMPVIVAKLTSATCSSSSSSPVASRSSQRASAGRSLALQSRAQAVQTADATTTSQGIAHGVRVAVVGVGLMGKAASFAWLGCVPAPSRFK
mgnify:CR=1 FL=1